MLEALEWATDHVQWHLVELGLCYSARLFVRIPPTFQKPHRGLYPRPDPTGRGIGVHRAGSLWMGPWMYSVEVSTDVPYRAVGCTVETRHIVTEHCFDHYTHAEHCWGQIFSLQNTVSTKIILCSPEMKLTDIPSASTKSDGAASRYGQYTVREISVLHYMIYINILIFSMIIYSPTEKFSSL